MPSLSKPPEYKGTGRPTKLNPVLQAKICQYIAKGNYISVACQAVGIDEATYCHWMNHAAQQADNGGGMYYDFFIAVKNAEAIAESELASMVRETALEKRDWLPAMTFLERRHPDRWGRKDRSRIEINETKEIRITHVEYNLAQPSHDVIEGESRELLEEGRVETKIT